MSSFTCPTYTLYSDLINIEKYVLFTSVGHLEHGLFNISKPLMSPIQVI